MKRESGSRHAAGEGERERGGRRAGSRGRGSPEPEPKPARARGKILEDFERFLSQEVEARRFQAQSGKRYARAR